MVRDDDEAACAEDIDATCSISMAPGKIGNTTCREQKKKRKKRCKKREFSSLSKSNNCQRFGLREVE
jgi:hypothetical protein